MRVRTLVAVVTCCIMLTVPTVAQAQLQPGMIVVTVIDQSTQRPIEGAEVMLTGGAIPITAYADDDGLVSFKDVPSQAYWIRAEAVGYEPVEQRGFDVLEGQKVYVTIALSKRLTKIGEVRAHSSMVVHSADIGSDSPERRVSTSLLGALSKVAGVSVDDSPSGPGFEDGISLNGNPQTATAYAVNGAPVGGAGNISLAQDLFAGASVSFSPYLGHLGGMVNFRTLRPTLNQQYKASFSAGTFDASSFSASATGSVGKLGVALQYTGRGIDSFLNGDRFEDQSGEDYVHRGGVDRIAEGLTLTYRPSDRNTATLSAMSATQSTQSICGRLLAAVTCGNGPGDYSSSAYRGFIFDDLMLFSGFQVNVEAARNSSPSEVTYANRTLFGIPLPLYSVTANDNATYAVSAFAQRGKNNLRVDYRIFENRSWLRQSAGDEHQYASSVERQTTWSIDDDIRISPKFDVEPQVQWSSSSYTAPGALFALSGRWTPQKADHWELALSRGSTVGGFKQINQLAPADEAAFDCANDTTLIAGPSDVPTEQRTTSGALTWQRDDALRGSRLQISLGEQQSDGIQRNLLLPFAPQAGGLLGGATDQYISELEAYWSEPLMCGALPLDLQRIYLSEAVSGLHQRIQYAVATGRIRIGSRLLLLPNISLNSVTFTSLDTRFLTAGNIYRAGVQIPGVPKYTAGVTIDSAGHNGLEALVNVQMVATNNSNNLPAYATLNGGVVLQRRAGSLAIVIANALSVDAFRMTTYRGVNPLSVIGGGSLAFPTTPLPPRELIVTFTPTIRTGAH